MKDCEAIRKVLLGHKENPEDRKWTIMGQSFGGFCAINYLSFFSDGLKEVFLTGGLAPLIDHPDPAYEALISEYFLQPIPLRYSYSICRKGYPAEPGILREISSRCEASKSFHFCSASFITCIKN